MENRQHRSIKLQTKYVPLAYHQSRRVPVLRISGLWLDQCGFHAGDTVDIAIVEGELHVTVLGGVRLTGLERMKITLKLVRIDKRDHAFRYHLDLYNSIHSEQLIEKSVEVLEVSTVEVSLAVTGLIAALENYHVNSTERYQTSNLEDLKEALNKHHPLK